MKKYFWLALIMIGAVLTYKALADEVDQKTDSSFIGGKAPKPIKSSFIGDVSNSVIKDSFIGEDVHKQTDRQFVGANTTNSDVPYFAGDTYQQQVGNSTVAPFAEENSKKAKDGVFIGQDVKKKTDGAFAGEDYGK